ncbi:MAG: hypothetical protein EG825_02100 [Rhodocyclaceae bacterium]|nr:hypothetical protein [Rhodocyclaceae bacterium]
MLIVTLMMLIAITMAGLALFRQVGTGAIIAGNLAFKQAATSAADRGVESARVMLTGISAVGILQGTTKTAAYYPAWCFTSQSDWGDSSVNSDCGSRDNSANPPFNPFTYNWTGTDMSISTGTDAMGNTVRYVVHRLCSMDGTPNEVREFTSGTGSSKAIQSCVLASGGQACEDRGLAYADSCIALSTQPFYRVTAQVLGPRNTVSYVEVILY